MYTHSLKKVTEYFNKGVEWACFSVYTTNGIDFDGESGWSADLKSDPKSIIKSWVAIVSWVELGFGWGDLKGENN